MHVFKEKITHSVKIIFHELGIAFRSTNLIEKSIWPSKTMTSKHSLYSALLQCHTAACFYLCLRHINMLLMERSVQEHIK